MLCAHFQRSELVYRWGQLGEMRSGKLIQPPILGLAVGGEGLDAIGLPLQESVERLYV